MNTNVNHVLDRLSVIFLATEEILNDWSADTNLQFPALLGMLTSRFNWNEKQLKEADAVVRYYVRNNPDWHVTRGARGGIMRAADKQKKQQALLLKEAAKKQMKEKIEASAPVDTSESTDTDLADLDED
jgi:hypothetical protein